MKNKTGLVGLEKLNLGEHNAVYLLEVEGETAVGYDGCHSSVAEVEKAFYLWKRIGFVKKEREYSLLRVENKVMTLESFNKEVEPSINEEAMSLCEAAMANVVGRRK